MVEHLLNMCEDPRGNAGIQNKPMRHCLFKSNGYEEKKLTPQNFSNFKMFCYGLVIYTSSKTTSITQLCKLPSKYLPLLCKKGRVVRFNWLQKITSTWAFISPKLISWNSAPSSLLQRQ